MYRFIEEHSQHYPVQVLCQTLQVSRSGYYEWLRPAPAPQPAWQQFPAPKGAKIDNQQQIRDLFGLHRRRYGTRRLVG